MNHLSVRIDSAAVALCGMVASKNHLFAKLAELAEPCYGVDQALVVNSLEKRESLGSTGFGKGIAIPHAKIESRDRCVGIFALLDEPMAFDAHDGLPVDMIFGLLSPTNGGVEHLKALAEISRFLRDENMLGKLRGASGDDAIYALLTGQREQQAA